MPVCQKYMILIPETKSESDEPLESYSEFSEKFRNITDFS